MVTEPVPLTELLVRAGEAVTRFRRRVTAEHGLSGTALGVLESLARTGGLSHRELAGTLGVTPATLTPVVDELERVGEVRRERDRDDRRIVRVWITDAGARRAESAGADVGETMRAALPEPSSAEAETVRRHLHAVLAAMSDDPTPASRHIR
ncbi:hypothetical protein GCM10009836_66700 [Pseudonocardia ailaonensis]|uniref:HTH marR-type domain-containing protein n=1 Tax=Pseudonocardia ailaonensis TaxID=367279 RepID=A0ABN2NMM8_9PSEU